MSPSVSITSQLANSIYVVPNAVALIPKVTIAFDSLKDRDMGRLTLIGYFIHEINLTQQTHVIVRAYEK